MTEFVEEKGREREKGGREKGIKAEAENSGSSTNNRGIIPIV
jgi:hypothetical protein